MDTGRPVTRRRLVALVAVLAGLTLIIASFQVWLTLPDGAGGTTSITGWGFVSGGAQMAGHNLNDLMSGYATYRPGLLPLIFGAAALLAAIGIAAVARSTRPHRIPAAVLALSGLVGLGWGLLRLLTPDSAGVLDAGEGHAGIGPWLTLGGGVLLIGEAVVVFAGLVDPQPPLKRRGIQPR